jgi:hypothetical protein
MDDTLESHSQQSLPPTTTRQDDITKAGQRKVNLVWEYTQAAIALFVVVANLIVGVWFGLTAHQHPVPSVEFPPVLSNTMFLIVGFYFSRTNHQAVGGIGRKPVESQEYLGR